MGCASSKQSGVVSTSKPPREGPPRNVTFAEKTIDIHDDRQFSSSTNSLDVSCVGSVKALEPKSNSDSANISTSPTPLPLNDVDRQSPIMTPSIPSSVKSEIANIKAETEREVLVETAILKKEQARQSPVVEEVAPVETVVRIEFDSNKTDDTSFSAKKTVQKQSTPEPSAVEEVSVEVVTDKPSDKIDNIPSNKEIESPLPEIIPLPPQTVTATSPEVEMSPKVPERKKGYILKQGHIVKNWKNRFFVLDKGLLTYYESSTANAPYGVNKKGEMDLRDISVSDCKSMVTLSARGKGQQDLILEIKYPNEREEWVAAIREHIVYIKAISPMLASNGGSSKA